MTEPKSFHISAGGGDLMKLLNRYDNFPCVPPEWKDRLEAAYRARGCRAEVTPSENEPFDADRVPFDGRTVTCAEWEDWLLNDPSWAWVQREPAA